MTTDSDGRAEPTRGGRAEPDSVGGAVRMAHEMAHDMPVQPPILSPTERAFLVGARRAVLATTASNGHVRLVPICFVVDDAHDELGRTVVWSPLDEKPKASSDPLELARVRDIRERPTVTLLVDRWDEDWTRLGWLRCVGTATVAGPDDPGHQAAVRALRRKYPQYLGHALERRPMLRIVVDRAVAWGTHG